MQINSENLAHFGVALDAAFEACQSIAVASQILVADYSGGQTHAAQQASLRETLSRYNTGNRQHGISNGYVRKVELAANEIVPAIDTDQRSYVTDAPSAIPTVDSDWDVLGELGKNAGILAQLPTLPAPKTASPTSLVFPDPGQ
jgi:type IV secretion system protein VirB1